MLKADVVIFEHGEHLTGKAYLAVHHGFFDIDYAVTLLARNARDGVALARFVYFGDDHRALVLGLESVADIDGDPARTHGENALGVQYVRAHIGKLAQFAVRKLLYPRGMFDYPRVGGEKTVDVRPVFIKFRPDRLGDERARDVRAAPAERMDKSAVVRAVKTGNDRILDAREPLSERGARGGGIELPARGEDDHFRGVHELKAQISRHYPAAEIFSARGEIFRAAIFIHALFHLVQAFVHVRIQFKIAGDRGESFAYLLEGRVEISVHFELVEAFIEHVGDLDVLRKTLAGRGHYDISARAVGFDDVRRTGDCLSVRHGRPAEFGNFYLHFCSLLRSAP